MRKIQNFSDLHPMIGFSEFDFYENFRLSFSDSELGKLRRLLPIEELARTIGLTSSHLGRNAYFSPEGKVALMFLKSHMGLSDKQLIDNLSIAALSTSSQQAGSEHHDSGKYKRASTKEAKSPLFKAPKTATCALDTLPTCPQY